MCNRVQFMITLISHDDFDCGYDFNHVRSLDFDYNCNVIIYQRLRLRL